MGSFGSRDHCGLGLESLGAEEDVLGDEFFGGLGVEDVEWRSGIFGEELMGSWWLGDGGLQMPEKEGDMLSDKMGESSRSLLMSAGEILASSSDQRAGESSRESSSSDIGMSKSVFHTASSTSSEDEWSCSYPNCDRKFTHRHKLK